MPEFMSSAEESLSIFSLSTGVVSSVEMSSGDNLTGKSESGFFREDAGRESFSEGTTTSEGKLLLRLSVAASEFFIAAGTGSEEILSAGTEMGLEILLGTDTEEGLGAGISSVKVIAPDETADFDVT